jgi:2-dehydropantoate 2-reductase
VGPVSIIGAGGIGCAVGYVLRAAGVDVTFVEADAGKIAWGRQHGVQVDHRPALPAVFLHFDEWQPLAGALVVLCTKCYDNATVLSRLPAQCHLIPIQNGFDPLLDAQGHALEGIASFVSECLPQRTHTRITRRGRLHLGLRRTRPGQSTEAMARRVGTTDQMARRVGATDQRLCAWLGETLGAAGLFAVEAVPNVLPYKYTKLMYNAAISPLAAAAGLDNGQLLGVPGARRLFFALLKENYAILCRAGIALARIGPFHPDTVQRILRCGLLATGMAWAFYPTLRGSYCSMAGDLPRGRTEIEYFNGHLLELAGTGPCPLNRAVYDLVKRLEQNPTLPNPRVLDELSLV